MFYCTCNKRIPPNNKSMNDVTKCICFQELWKLETWISLVNFMFRYWIVHISFQQCVGFKHEHLSTRSIPECNTAIPQSINATASVLHAEWGSPAELSVYYVTGGRQTVLPPSSPTTAPLMKSMILFCYWILLLLSMYYMCVYIYCCKHDTKTKCLQAIKL